MKIRKGFVSNSSSSSFVILGKYIKKSELNLNLIKDNGFKLYFAGKYLSEGRDIIELNTKEMLNAFKYLYKNKPNYYEGEFILSYLEFNEDVDDFTLSIDDLKSIGLKDDDKFLMINISKDYHCNSSLNDVNYNYFDDMPDFEKIIKNLDREEKLKRINND